MILTGWCPGFPQGHPHTTWSLPQAFMSPSQEGPGQTTYLQVQVPPLPSPPAQFPCLAFLWWHQASLSIRVYLNLIGLTFQSPPLEHEPHVSRDLCLFHVCICSMRKSSWPIVGAQQMMKVTFGHQPQFMPFSELTLLNVQYVSSRTSSPYLHSHTGIIRNRYSTL